MCILKNTLYTVNRGCVLTGGPHHDFCLIVFVFISLCKHELLW